MTARRGRPHVPVEDPDTPGVCLTCRRPTAARSDRHLTVDQLPTTDPDIADAERRRLGEHD